MIEGVHFALPDLRAIDASSAEVIACTLWSDQRPMRGLAGLLDWRLAGRLSALAKNGFLRGDQGEMLLVPGRPHLSFEKVIVLGLGARSAFGDGVVRSTLTHLSSALDGLKVKRALVEMPGRGDGVLDVERAADLLIECAHSALESEAWTLVDVEAAREALLKRTAHRPRTASGA